MWFILVSDNSQLLFQFIVFPVVNTEQM